MTTISGEMTVSALAAFVDRNPHWVRGACAARGIELRRYGTSDVVNAEGCDEIIRLSRTAPRPRSYRRRKVPA